MNWDHVVEFCRNNGLNVVPELWRGKKKDFDPNLYLERNFKDDFGGWYPNIIQLSDPKTVDEGVVIRVDKMRPKFYKIKSPSFVRMESEGMDNDIVDIESAS